MKRNVMCPTHSVRATFKGSQHCHRVSKTDEGNIRTPKWVNPRVRLQCPTCGRRVTARVSFCHDGCCTNVSLPPHKVKQWTKHDAQWAHRRMMRQRFPSSRRRRKGVYRKPNTHLVEEDYPVRGCGDWRYELDKAISAWWKQVGWRN